MAVDSVDAPQRRVLVVDDEATIVEFLTMGLTYEGWAVSAAMDGDAAIELARREQPDLIILDLMLPGVDGLAVCRGLRERSDVPIIMLTARGGLEERVAGLDGGADDYIVKPFHFQELPARIGAVIRRRGVALRRGRTLRPRISALALARHAHLWSRRRLPRRQQQARHLPRPRLHHGRPRQRGWRGAASGGKAPGAACSGLNLEELVRGV